MAVKEYFLPQSLDEAVRLLAEHGSSLFVMAGGTIAMTLINEGVVFPEKVMGLRHAGLDQIHQTKDSLTIGATTTLSQLSEQTAIPMLQEAARNAAGWSIRNMGTVGGNICAPPPAGDVAVALLALAAQIKLVGPKGERVIPLTDFYTGYMTNLLQPAELLAEIQVSIPVGKTIYLKYGRKQANTPSIVTVAAYLKLDGDKVTEAAIALNGAGPHPFRAKKAEAALTGASLTTESIAAAATAATEESNPLDDAIASAWYRRKMVGVYVSRVLNQLLEQEN